MTHCKHTFLLSLLCVLFGACKNDGKSAVQTLPQESRLFVQLPEYCPTPDGMAIAENGDLILACPNYADPSQAACIVRIDPDKKVTKWFDVPVLAETGIAAPMGIAFDKNGDLIICDNQGWNGQENTRNKGRLLRIRFKDGNPEACIVIASGMEHPNGVRIYGDQIYVTQSMLSDMKDPSGLLVSGVYRFNPEDRDLVLTNTAADPQLITTVVTRNKEVQYGLDGLVFDKNGNLYVGNFGDGALHKITFDKAGNVLSNDVWAEDQTQLRTTDGMCMDDQGNIWVADFSENAIARVDPQGRIRRIAQSPDCDGSNGGLDQPGEPIVWNNRVVISCFDIVTGPDKVNTKHDFPFTLTSLMLE